MNDSHLPPPDVSFFARVFFVFLCIFIGATLVFQCSGCASSKPPDPLAASIALNNGAVDALAKAERDEAQAFRLDFVQRLAKCPVGDRGCHAVAAHDALVAHANDSVRLSALASLQHAIGRALLLAKECRGEKQAECEADALRQAELRLPELKAGLDDLLRGIPTP